MLSELKRVVAVPAGPLAPVQHAVGESPGALESTRYQLRPRYAPILAASSPDSPRPFKKSRPFSCRPNAAAALLYLTVYHIGRMAKASYSMEAKPHRSRHRHPSSPTMASAGRTATRVKQQVRDERTSRNTILPRPTRSTPRSGTVSASCPTSSASPPKPQASPRTCGASPSSATSTTRCRRCSRSGCSSTSPASARSATASPGTSASWPGWADPPATGRASRRRSSKWSG